MKRRALVWLQSVLGSMILAWVAVAAAQSPPSPAPKVGVFYFPGWKEGALGLAYPKPWEPIKRFPEREPMLGWYDEGRVSVMEQHLAWMASHALDYVVFDWYWGGERPVLDHALKAYRASSGKSKVPYAVMWANHEEQVAPAAHIVAMVEHLARHHFTTPEYLKVDGKPLLFIMEPGKVNRSAMGAGMNHRQLSERFQAAARAAGLPGVMLVGGANGGVNGVTQNAKAWGYSAYFIYSYASGVNGTRGQPRESHNYAEFDDNFREHWAWFMKNGDMPYVIPMSAGFDRRPWGGSADPKHDLSVSTLEQFTRHLTAGRDLIRREPAKTLGMGLICCWNEFGEGSYIEPTKAQGMNYLRAVKSVFGQP